MTKRIACIRWLESGGKLKNAKCKLQIDRPTESVGNFQFSICILPCLIERCHQFSPIVGLEPTDRESILLDIAGLAHLFGGETAFCEAVIRDLARQGLAARVAIADTIGAAWAGAHYGRGKTEEVASDSGQCHEYNHQPSTINHF